ncbi:GNAT family N-acetyltransferase [Herminiimonas fonticola]|uniref:GNAT family N-acetyltransferase n=1 Tax=Herminiimonas fonticola TaxID=303380 RepID=UPI00333F7366
MNVSSHEALPISIQAEKFTHHLRMKQQENETGIKRYEWRDEEQLFGFVEYYMFGEICIITHTEVLPALAGRGYGSKLAAQTMEYARSQNRHVVPICGFMVNYLRKNPQYLDLLTPESRRIFNIGNIE